MAMGHPPEEAMRTCLLATGLARSIGIAEAEVADVYWTSLLMHVGCTATAHEQSMLFGDEIAMNAAGSKTDFGNPREVVSFLMEMGRGRRLTQRARLFVVGFVRGEREGSAISGAICEVAATTAERLGFSEAVPKAIGQLFERWDGKGDPHGLKEEAILRPARIAQLASEAVVFDRMAGSEAAVEMARRRAGSALDPHLVEAFVRSADALIAEVNRGDPWRRVLDTEPAPQRWVSDSRIDDVAEAFADVIDLKSTYTLGHSTRVARLAESAASALGFSDQEAAQVRRAGYLHDLGRVGVPNAIWEKTGKLTSAEWEQVRLHPYHSERILSRSPALAPLAKPVGMHHERLDGSGYYRGSTAGSIPMAARVLAAADAYEGWTQARAHRAALSPSEAADRLAKEAEDGKFDADAVNAVLSAAGHEQTKPVRQGWPADLTDREVDVLRHVARGLSNRDVADRLFISPKTVGRHVEHIYQKIGVSSRAAAALFAVRHDLLRGSGPA